MQKADWFTKQQLTYKVLRDFLIFLWYNLGDEWNIRTGRNIPSRIAWIKHLYFYLAKKYIGTDYNEIAKYTNRGRCAVYNSRGRVEFEMKINDKYKQNIENIEAAIKKRFRVNNDLINGDEN